MYVIGTECKRIDRYNSEAGTLPVYDLQVVATVVIGKVTESCW